eukprot:CAMPEP_0113647236 /NCGR_PEP_ID=MMETSP0017_2-20120614/24995_1 /TAXON_ID=2856 /ORGANISM="Cylindrotheca closterium" /LENGTH=487 /DNA_ID=CAMNT_0000559263 /DNA_START=77 /DNA_END=1540 /DNA_ORIENTATION=+ /assembly_acc=CAM_ASM_000147
MNTNHKCHEVTLRDGQRVDIATKEGADAFLKSVQVSNFKYFSQQVEKLTKPRKKGKLPFNTKLKIHDFFGYLAENADKDLFREKIPESEIRCWMNYVIQEIKQLTTNKSWIQTGDSMGACVLQPFQTMFMHAVPVALAFETGFFQVLSNFVKARKAGANREMPSQRICNILASAVCWTVIVSTTRFDNKWTTSKAFRKLDDSGFLEEFLRIATVPQARGGWEWEMLCQVLYALERCPDILNKRFKKGEACGETLQAILGGSDGSRNMSSQIKERLLAIAKAKMKTGSSSQIGRGCSKCGKFGWSESFDLSMMHCARCKAAFYCSRECQRADWKHHKKTCIPYTKRDLKDAAKAEDTLVNFFTEHGVRLVSEMSLACQMAGGLDFNEMVIELDFKLDKDGIVPAMKQSPIIKIEPIQNYTEGSRQARPQWFSTIEDSKPETYDALVKILADESAPRNSLKFLFRSGEQNVYCITYVVRDDVLVSLPSE